MKITNITKSEVYFVDTDEKEFNCYTRYSPDNWTVRMGESDESTSMDEELEPLFQMELSRQIEPQVSQAASQAMQKPEDLKHVICPQCGKPFKLDWNGYDKNPMTLRLRGCPSGGIYDVSIHCPHCNYEEEL